MDGSYGLVLGTYGAGMELGSHFSGALISHFFLGSPLFAHWHRVVGHSGAWFFQFSTSQLLTHLVRVRVRVRVGVRVRVRVKVRGACACGQALRFLQRRLPVDVRWGQVRGSSLTC